MIRKEQADHLHGLPYLKMKKELIYKSRILGNVPVTISVNRSANKCLYIGLDKRPDEYGDDYFGSITVNLPGSVPEHCAYVNTNNLSEVLPFLKEYKLAKPLPVVGESGSCAYPLFQFVIECLHEYAPEDVKTYLAGTPAVESEV